MNGLPPKLRVATDIAAFAVEGSRLTVLLIERGPGPHEINQGKLALPGGFLREDEDLDACAKRVLSSEAGFVGAELHQFHTYGAPDRDARQRIVSVAYLALVKPSPLRSGSHASRAAWFDVDPARPLAFDHNKILENALAALRRMVQHTSIAFSLLPEQFTLSELQAVHEAVLGQSLDKRNFRRAIVDAGLVQPLDQMRKGHGRPAQLYRAIHSGA